MLSVNSLVFTFRWWCYLSSYVHAHTYSMLPICFLSVLCYQENARKNMAPHFVGELSLLFYIYPKVLFDSNLRLSVVTFSVNAKNKCFSYIKKILFVNPLLQKLKLHLFLTVEKKNSSLATATLHDIIKVSFIHVINF